MLSTKLDSKRIEALTNESNITFTENFEQITEALNKFTTKFWFDYNDEFESFPFELSVTVTQNRLDETDYVPLIELAYTTNMVKNGRAKCMGNHLLDDEKRKKDIQQFYFHFEDTLLASLTEQNAVYSYRRDNHMYEIFENFNWFAENKGIASSGRNEKVENLSFSRGMWKSEEDFRKCTVLAEGKEAKQYVQFFLRTYESKKIVQDFLFHVLQSGKDIRIVTVSSHWNYHFVIRPDMLCYDSTTLLRLGQSLNYNSSSYEDRFAAMTHVFDHFSSFDTVNICLTKESLKELNDARIQPDFSFDDLTPLGKKAVRDTIANNLSRVQNKIKNMKSENDKEYRQFKGKQEEFLDGLLDLHNRYKELSEIFDKEKYLKRAERVKQLWHKFNQ